MESPGYFGDGPAAMRERDFTEAISLRMRVPERLRVGPARHAHEPEDLSAAYSMHIPDRLALTGIFLFLKYKSQEHKLLIACSHQLYVLMQYRACNKN